MDQPVQGMRKGRQLKICVGGRKRCTFIDADTAQFVTLRLFRPQTLRTWSGELKVVERSELPKCQPVGWS